MRLKKEYYKKLCVNLSMICLVGMLCACGESREPLNLEIATKESTVGVGTTEESTEDSAAGVGTTEEALGESTEDSVGVGEEAENASPAGTAPTMTILPDGSIKEQTFDVKISGMDEKVTFVPYVPTEENPNLQIEILQNGEHLSSFTDYAPDAVSGEKFTSLDAVSFYDINCDGNTDIVMVETYGDTRFLAIYYGTEPAMQDYGSYFVHQSVLSDGLTQELKKTGEVSVSALRQYLTGGKKNGEFSSYKEAYEMICRLAEAEYGSEELAYNLIYFDEDDVPELVIGKSGYYVSLYSYQDGSVHTLMDHWSYGAMGNVGYEYAPKKNSLRNYNSDYAGLIMYATYMELGEKNSLEVVAEIVYYNFDDANENGCPDEEEMASVGQYGATYINGKEVLAENEEAEVNSYDVGDYEYIDVNLTLEELKKQW